MTTPVTEGDIRATFGPAVGYVELTVQDRDLERDTGLETAVTVSLGTWRRAEPDDPLPDEDGPLNGYWADTLEDESVNILGSKLWLIGRSKIVASDIIPKAEQWAREALQWMISDGVASDVSVIAERVGTYEIKITVQIQRPDAALAETYRYYYNWQNQELRG